MGVNVQIESERGVVESRLLDPRGVTMSVVRADLASETHCLQFVDPYGDAVFNHLQLPTLIDEVRRALQKTGAARTRTHGMEILNLLESARDKVHTYVRFVGD